MSCPPNDARQRIPSTASDVILDIVATNNSLQSIGGVIYTESLNWVERIDKSRLTSARLKQAVRQDNGRRVAIEIDRNEVLDGRLMQIENELAPNQLLAIISRVRLSRNRVMHIPMMDFRCAISKENLRTLGELLPEIGQRTGFILESGRSYHFYGKELLADRDWPVFVGRCLLMKNYSDERYIGHQLVDGHCVLRLSISRLKPRRPIVVMAL